jgi:hypothetical protein
MAACIREAVGAATNSSISSRTLPAPQTAANTWLVVLLPNCHTPSSPGPRVLMVCCWAEDGVGAANAQPQVAPGHLMLTPACGSHPGTYQQQQQLVIRTALTAAVV